MMKRFVKMIFFIAIFLLLAGLVLPGFINWNQHKDKIQRQLSLYFQRHIEIAGNVSLQVLPQPEVILQSVTVANAEGASSAPYMTLKELGLRVKFQPLLQGKVEVESISLVDPVWNLEILPGGKPNWQGVLKDESAQMLGGAAGAVQLNQMVVINGSVSYANAITGTKLKIDNLNLIVKAATLLGPYNVEGTMQYRDLPVNIELATEKYMPGAPLPLRFGFIPVKGLAQVKFGGVADLQSGIDLQGEISAGQGNLADLLGFDAFKGIRFMHDPIDLRSVLEFKSGQFSFNDIKAKFGQKGELTGKLSVQVTRDGKPFIQADLDAAHLTVVDKGGDLYVGMPDGFSGSLHMKGRNIGWGNYRLSGVDVTSDFDPKEWRMKSARVDLPGNTVLKAAGIISPLEDSGNYNIQLTTEDLAKLVQSLTPSDASIFKLLGDTGIVRKLTVASGLSVSPARISLYNLDVTAEGKMKVTGVLNIDRLVLAPNAVAKLNFSDWDMTAAAPESFESFLQKIMAANTDLEITSSNFSHNGLRLPELALRGKTGETGMDLSYAVKIAEAGAAPLPPPLLWNGADLTGEVKGTPQSYTFTANGTGNGSEVTLTGAKEAGIYELALHLKNQNGEAALAQLGLPLTRLMGDKGAFELTGDVKGVRGDYRIDQIKANVGGAAVTGSLQKKSGQLIADLTTQKIDLDKWLVGDWKVRHATTLNLHSEDLIWQGQHITNPQVAIQADAASVHLANFAGTLWGGQLMGDLALTRREGSWSSTLTGSVKQADLSTLVARLGLDGFSAGIGDIDVNLTSPDNTPQSAAGSFNVKASTLRIERFNDGKLGEMAANMTAVPPMLQQMVEDSLRHNGASSFRDVQGQFRVEGGRITIENLKLADLLGDVDVSASANIREGSYNVTGLVRLRQPAGFPAFKITRAASDKDYNVETAPIAAYVRKNNPEPVPMQPDVDPLPQPAIAKPPVQLPPEEKHEGDIKGILKRLDDDAPEKEGRKDLPELLSRQTAPEKQETAVP